MIDYNEQKVRCLSLIQNLTNFNFETNTVAKITERDDQNRVVGFPYMYFLYIEYKDAPELYMVLKFHLDQDGISSKIEISSIDIAKKNRLHCLGRRLINYATNIDKEVGAKIIFGVVLDQDNYSS